MSKIWKKTEGWKLPLVGVIGLTFALVSVLGRAETPPKEPVTTPPIAPYESSIAGIGVVEPQSELIEIGTELPGIAREIHVKVGDHVKKGDPLFSLDQRDIDAQISVLEASLKSAQVQAEEAVVQFKLVSDIKDKRAVAQDDYNRRKYAAELSKSRVNETEAKLNEAKTTKQRLTITAPIDGTILNMDIRPGEFATAGVLSKPLIKMGDLAVFHVRVEFDEENAAKLSKDDPAQAFKRGDASRPYLLSFIRFEPYVGPKQNLAVTGQRVDTRVLQAIYALPADTKDLLTGQQMDVFVQAKTVGSAP